MSQLQRRRPSTSLIVYACDRCTEILTFLETYGVPYTLVDIEEDLEASMLVAEANQGQFLMPLVQIGDEFYRLPTPAELAERLGVEHPGT